MKARLAAWTAFMAGMGVAIGGCGNPGAGTAFAGGSAGAGASTSAGIGGGGAPGGQGPTAGSGGAMGGATGGSGLGGGTSGGAGQSGASDRGGSSNGGAGAGGTGVGGVGGASGAGTAGASGTGEAGASGGGNAGGGQAGATAGTGGRSISFGTLLDAQAVVSAAQGLATSAADPSSPEWRAKGDQHRSYYFAAANADQPYRLCVPTGWDGTSPLPLVMFLHGAGSNENTYLDQNNKQLVTLAEQHGFLLVAPLGVEGAYGNFLRLTAPFGDEAGAAELMAQVTPESERTNELSEQDVINVLELVLSEYPIDRGSMFLGGHSMGSGGTWYIGGKYVSYWKGLAPMSGPFVQESGYPWASVRAVSIFVTEGTQTPSLDASRLLGDWLSQNGFTSEYLEVNADHGGMVALVLPDIFDFFDRSR